MSEERKYKLISGEEIDLAALRKRELEHIESLEKCINGCTHHDRADYFYIYTKASKPMEVGGSKEQIRNMFSQPYYKVIKDLVDRYWHKCFGEEQED